MKYFFVVNLVDYDDVEDEKDELLPPQPDEIKDGQWLGKYLER